MRNPLTFEAFAEWCEKQPARKRYDFWDPRNCACARYSESIGGERNAYPDPSLFWLEANDIAHGGGQTFGSLAKRLRESV